MTAPKHRQAAIAAPPQKTVPATFEQMLPPKPARRVTAGPGVEDRVTKIFAIGASQGGVQALRVLLAGLPADFAAPVLIVQHIGATESILPAILADASSLPTAFALDGEPLLPGRVYVAPPDHHMLVNDGKLELTRGPRENWARPAIDPLFRAAALYYAQDAIGIVLSGRLNDGTAGLYEIKRWGGLAMVQTPREAEAPDMPQSALDNVP